VGIAVRAPSRVTASVAATTARCRQHAGERVARTGGIAGPDATRRQVLGVVLIGKKRAARAERHHDGCSRLPGQRDGRGLDAGVRSGLDRRGQHGELAFVGRGDRPRQQADVLRAGRRRVDNEPRASAASEETCRPQRDVRHLARHHDDVGLPQLEPDQ
jgi:hypothetical protein